MQSLIPQKLLAKLTKAPLHNLNLLGFFQFHPVERIVETEDCIMLCGKSDELWWYFDCNNQAMFLNFLQKLDGGEHFFVVINNWMLNEIKRNLKSQWVLSCIRLYLPSHVELPQVEIEISDLTPKDTSQIFNNSNYQSFTSPEYIGRQIENRNRGGVAFRDGNTLAGWALFHDDGAMGLLHVIDSYRRKGIARALVVELCQRLRQQDNLPYTSVEPTNTASLKLVSSLGFVALDTIHWVKAVK